MDHALRPDTDYRPDIDGLRALAVMVVVLYHYKLGPFIGGFTGVDVFFVISGYLITRILWREMSIGHFSIVTFYERRFRRIVPPLLTVVVFVFGFGWYVLLPSDFQSLGGQALAGILGFSNLYFWWTTDYFARAASMRPLLHTWSLGVEEQFYLIWPLLLLSVWIGSKNFKARAVTVMMILIVIAISFITSIFAVTRDPVSAFYLPLFRAWELALGGLLVFAPPIASRLTREALSLTGVVLVIGSALFISSEEPFPGWLALPPCLGAAMIILPRSGGSVASKVLGTKPLTWIGKISYSLYLWHWPILVLFRHESFGQYPDRLMSSVLLTISLLLATATWVVVETPARNPQTLKRRQLALVGTPLIMILAFVAVTVVKLEGVPSRLPDNLIVEEKALRSPLRERCHQRRSFEPLRSCVLGDQKVAPDTVVWGDSHGVELSDALGESYRRERRSLLSITLSGCPPALGYASAARPSCGINNAEVLKYILEGVPSAGVVVIASYHFVHLQRVGKQYADGLVETVRRLTSAGKKVVVVGPIPDFAEPIPLVAARMAWRGHNEGPSITRSAWDTKTSDVLSMLSLLTGIDGAQVVDVSGVFCDQNRCLFTKHGRPLLFDDNHPSLEGANEISTLLRSKLDLLKDTSFIR